MIEKKKIDRINELAKKLKEGTITEEEREERSALHKEYIAAVKGSVKDHLSRIKFVEDLTKEELEQMKSTKKTQNN